MHLLFWKRIVHLSSVRKKFGLVKYGRTTLLTDESPERRMRNVASTSFHRNTSEWSRVYVSKAGRSSLTDWFNPAIRVLFSFNTVQNWKKSIYGARCREHYRNKESSRKWIEGKTQNNQQRFTSTHMYPSLQGRVSALMFRCVHVHKNGWKYTTLCFFTYTCVHLRKEKSESARMIL